MKHASRHSSQQGFTLIELMIAMLIASLLIGMAFAIYTRMSVAYRGQSAVAELQQSLQAAQADMVKHLRMAGHLVPDGVATPDGALPPLARDNASAAESDFHADVITVHYASAAAMAVVLEAAGTSLTVDAMDDELQAGDRAVIVNPRSLPSTGMFEPAAIARYDACLVTITGVAAGAPATLGVDGLGHCAAALDTVALRPGRPVLYLLVSRAYRIDPTPARRALGVLQVSPSGGLTPGDWQDMGIGFVDLQVAVRAFEPTAGIDRDGDGDAARNWYSGDVEPPPDAIPIELGLSLLVRTTRDLNVVPTRRLPRFRDDANPEHNPLGDAPWIDMETEPEATWPPQYRGKHVYRYSTVRIDLRNLGVGRGTP